MASVPHTIQIREISRVSPPLNSVPQTSLPLTFFDVYCLPGPPVKRLFFYELIHSKTYLIDTVLPKLKRSLSLTLQHFYPLSGNLTHSPESGKLVIRYLEGDSVELTLAESDAEFYQFLQNSPRDVTRDHLFTPDLPLSDPSATPVLALQVTIFPGSGFCVGMTTHHAAVDLRSSLYFMKSWASICRLGDASSLDPLPFHDRSVIKDPNGLETIFSEQWKQVMAEKSLFEIEEKRRVDSVLARFVLKRADIERLRRLVSARLGDSLICSTFVLTSAYVWACSAKTRHDDRHDTEQLIFAGDVRARLEPPVPETYFGNCVATCFVQTKRSDLVGEDGVGIAAEAVGTAIGGLKNEVLRGAEDWIPKLGALREHAVSVGGSPKFRIYETDFGWGRPSKVEVLFGPNANGMSLTENRNEEEGGVEISVARPRHQMDVFASLFQEGLKDEEKKNGFLCRHSRTIYNGVSASPWVSSRTSTESFSNRRADRPPLTSGFFGITSTRHYSTNHYSIDISSIATTISEISHKTTPIRFSNQNSGVVDCYPFEREHLATRNIQAKQSFSFCRENLHRRIGYFWRTFRHVLA